jgi:hypothetical protein
VILDCERALGCIRGSSNPQMRAGLTSLRLNHANGEQDVRISALLTGSDH